MADREILASLAEAPGCRNVDMGGGGNCLFLSMVPQISDVDVQRMQEGEHWPDLGLRARAKLLRSVAMQDELDFIAQLRHCLQAEQQVVPQSLQWRGRELFKDMLEEFASRGLIAALDGLSSAPPRGTSTSSLYGYVRQAAADTPLDETLGFVVQHAKEYIRLTSVEGAWAGSSEMVALASALRRPIEAYGNDWVSQDAVEVELGASGLWQVCPYFRSRQRPAADEDEEVTPSAEEQEPIRVFQTNGGGHYQMLASASR